MLMLLQMFKFVLLRAIQTTVRVFSDAKVPGVRHCKQLVKDCNLEAEVLWKREGADFLARRAQCKAIHGRYFRELDQFPTSKEMQPVPPEAAAVLDSIFKKHYKTTELCLLFGRTEDKALDVQDAYGLSIAAAMRKIDSRYESRANLHLRKRYGRGAAMPLLSMASVEAMWEVCSSYFYRVQIRTVSGAVATIVTSR